MRVLLDKLATLLHVLPRQEQVEPEMHYRCRRLAWVHALVQNAGWQVVLSQRIFRRLRVDLAQARADCLGAFEEYERRAKGFLSPAAFFGHLRTRSSVLVPRRQPLAFLVSLIQRISVPQTDRNDYQAVRDRVLCALSDTALDNFRKQYEHQFLDEPAECPAEAGQACRTRELLARYVGSSRFEQAKGLLTDRFALAQRERLDPICRAVRQRLGCPPPAEGAAPAEGTAPARSPLDDAIRTQPYRSFVERARQGLGQDSPADEACLEWLEDDLSAFEDSRHLAASLEREIRQGPADRCLCLQDPWVAMALRSATPLEAGAFPAVGSVFALDRRLWLVFPERLWPDQLDPGEDDWVPRRREFRRPCWPPEPSYAFIRPVQGSPPRTATLILEDVSYPLTYGIRGRLDAAECQPYVQQFSAPIDGRQQSFLACRRGGDSEAGFRNLDDFLGRYDPLPRLATPCPL